MAYYMRVSDWHISVAWNISGVFATGAVWYFASAKDWSNVVLTIIAALVTAGLAILQHKKKDSQQANDVAKSAALERQSLSKNPTKGNIETTILQSDPEKDWIGHEDNDRSVYSYADDVNLRLEILNHGSGIHCEDFKEPWANRFPDRRATSYWCNLFYGSTQIERYVLVAVDGARALLPIPKVGPPGEVPMHVLPIDYKVAQINDTINSLDLYMARAGLRVAMNGA